MVPKMKNPFDESEREPSALSDDDVFKLTPCCCCLCACSHDRVGDATCCGCFPIRCGIIFIGLFIFVLSIVLLLTTFFKLQNDYFPWWYVFVEILCEVPLITASMITVYFFRRDKRSTRNKLLCAIICATVSIFLWAVW